MGYKSFSSIKLPEKAKEIISRLERGGFSAFVVGGAVRDSLTGREATDFDIATSALPEETERLFQDLKVFKTGEKHGTVTVVIDGENFEVTTFRKDKGYSDMRRPDEVEFVTSLEEDLKRRDFTVNALAYNEKTGIVDVCGGLDDLKNGVIRTVGAPNERFGEDALRILRALRFSSQLGFAIEANTAKSIFAYKERLKTVSGERVFHELKKLLLGKNSEEVLTEFAEVIFVVIPELADCYKFEQKSSWHSFDVYTHIVKATAVVKNTAELKFTALLHDVEKPRTFFMKNGEGHFYGHAEQSAETAKKTLKRLKAPNVFINDVYTLVKYHDIPIGEDEYSIKKRLCRFGEKSFFDLVEMKRADNSGQGTKKADEERGKVVYIKEKAKEIVERGDCFSLSSLKVNGDDLVGLGYKGIEVGVALDKLLDRVMRGEVANDREELLKTANGMKRK